VVVTLKIIMSGTKSRMCKSNRIRLSLIIVGIALVLVLVLSDISCSSARPDASPTVVTAIMQELTIEQITANADSIIIGKVIDTAVKKDMLTGNINTYISVNVEEWIKGTTDSNVVTIREQGGEIGDERQWAEDSVQFSNGEKVLLFLKSNGDKTSSVLGGFQGKVTLEKTNTPGRIELTVGNNPAEVIKRVKAAVAGESR